MTFVHEGGHLAAALAANRKIYAYNIAGKLKWLSRYAPHDKQRYVRAPLSHHEGVVSYDTRNLSPEERRMHAAAGCAGELVYFNQIESMLGEQENDRKKGGFQSILDIAHVADAVADRFETGDLHKLYSLVMHRLAKGEGFDDMNEIIDCGYKLNEVFGE